MNEYILIDWGVEMTKEEVYCCKVCEKPVTTEWEIKYRVHKSCFDNSVNAIIGKVSILSD